MADCFDEILAEEAESPVGRKHIVRFNSFHDIMLLREVVAENPFSISVLGIGNKRRWDNVADRLSTYMPNVTGRCCKERALRLLKFFKANDRASLRRAGTEDQYNEKEQILQEVLDLEQEGALLGSQQPRQKKKQEDDSTRVAEIQAAAMAFLECPSLHTDDDSMDDLDLSYHSSRKRKSISIANYLVKKHVSEAVAREKELQIKLEQIDLERRRVTIEERKVELEAERAKQEFEDRREQRQMMMQLMNLISKK